MASKASSSSYGPESIAANERLSKSASSAATSFSRSGRRDSSLRRASSVRSRRGWRNVRQDSTSSRRLERAFIVFWAALESFQKSGFPVSASSSVNLASFAAKSKTLQKLRGQFLYVG